MPRSSRPRSPSLRRLLFFIPPPSLPASLSLPLSLSRSPSLSELRAFFYRFCVVVESSRGSNFASRLEARKAKKGKKRVLKRDEGKETVFSFFLVFCFVSFRIDRRRELGRVSRANRVVHRSVNTKETETNLRASTQLVFVFAIDRVSR